MKEKSDAAGLIIALATLVFHVATAKGYGYFRDELYYLANAEHLDFGYVDHPPLVSVIAWLVRHTLGDSLYAIRFLPAVAAAATVYVTAQMARELGGGRWAQGLAALAAALAPIYLSLFTIFSMNAFDLFFWALASFLVLRILRTGDLRGWLPFGVVTGIGLQNKISILFLGFGVTAGLVVNRDWRHFKSRWLWLGGLLSAAIFAPHVVWQIANGWPTREFIANATEFKNLVLSPWEFLKDQVLMLNPLTLPLWGAGLVYFLFSKSGRPYRAIGFTYFAVLVLMLTQNAKTYYLSPIYTMLFAAGAVLFERMAARPKLGFLKVALPGVTLVSGLVLAPLAKPLLSEDAYVRYSSALGIAPSSGERHRLGRLPQFFADMHGWRELAAAVAEVYDDLPAEEKSRACAYGQNYGEAGAIDFFRSEMRLPPAISGHNSYFLWGPGSCTGEVIIVIGDDRASLEEVFEDVTQAATFRCTDCMPYESDLPLWVARRLRMPLVDLWTNVRHYD